MIYFIFVFQFSFGSDRCKVKLTAKKNKDETFTYKQNGAIHTHTLDARDQEVGNSKKMGNATHEIGTAASASGTTEGIIGQKETKRKGNHPPAPKSLAALDSPNVLTTTNEKFLLYDSRQDIHKEDTNNRIIIFSTQSALDFLATCDTIFMDGTFSSAPALFENMCIIHGEYGL